MSFWALFAGDCEEAKAEEVVAPQKPQQSRRKEDEPLRTPVGIDLNNDGKVDVVLTPDQLRALVLERQMALQAPVHKVTPPVPPVLVQPPSVVYQAPRVPPSKVPRGRWVWVPRTKLLEQADLRKMATQRLREVPPQAEAATQMPSQVPTPAPASSASLQRSTQSQLLQGSTQSQLYQVPASPLPSTRSAVPVYNAPKYEETFQSVKVPATSNVTPYYSEMPYHHPQSARGAGFSSTFL
ncbi:unnamed protein product [Symbiodinium sp. CCMP2592]|nr:unnamed protein product [Symbiodinium sp. CCMP2592]